MRPQRCVHRCMAGSGAWCDGLMAGSWRALVHGVAGSWWAQVHGVMDSWRAHGGLRGMVGE